MNEETKPIEEVTPEVVVPEVESAPEEPIKPEEAIEVPVVDGVTPTE